jgi:hypothetical protein
MRYWCICFGASITIIETIDQYLVLLAIFTNQHPSLRQALACNAATFSRRSLAKVAVPILTILP